jgi:hypothetical protein
MYPVFFPVAFRFFKTLKAAFFGFSSTDSGMVVIQNRVWDRFSSVLSKVFPQCVYLA